MAIYFVKHLLCSRSLRHRLAFVIGTGHPWHSSDPASITLVIMKQKMNVTLPLMVFLSVGMIPFLMEVTHFLGGNF